MKKMNNISWRKLLRSMVAMMLVMAMLLCGGCGKDPEETTNPNALGDGDGKLEAQDFVDGFTTIYGTMLGSMGGQTATSSGSEMDISLTLGDDILSYVSSMMEAYGMPTDTSWLKQIAIGMDMNYSENLSQMAMALSLGQTDILSAEMIMDMAGNMMYVALPQVNSQYIGVVSDFSDLNSSYIGTVEQMGSYAELVAALPTEAELNTLLTRYLNLLLEKLEDPATGTETLSHGGISQEVTATTHTIRRSDVLDMAEAVLKAAQTDAELEKMLDNICKFYNEQGAKEAADSGYVWSNEDFHQTLMDEIEPMLQSLSEARADLEDGDFLIFTLYTEENAALGFRLNIVDEFEGGEVYLYNLTDGDNTAFAMDLMTMQLTGTGTNAGGKAAGNYTLTVEGTEMAYVEVKDFDMEALEKGELSGTLRLSLSTEAIEEYFGSNPYITSASILEVVLNAKENSASITCNLYSGSAFILGISINTKVVSAQSIQIPTDYANTENQEDMAAWLDAISLTQVLENLRAAGVPAELVDMLEANLDGMI